MALDLRTRTANFSPSQVHGSDLLAPVTHLMADGDTRLVIDDFLLARELLQGRPTVRRAFPAGQFLVARLGVEMPVSVKGMNSDPLTLVTKMLEVVDASVSTIIDGVLITLNKGTWLRILSLG